MKILRFKDLRDQKGIGFSRVHLARLEEAGKFPRRIRIAENTIGWLESEVDAWLKARIAESREKAA